jgi:DNA replication protein DnaC
MQEAEQKEREYKEYIKKMEKLEGLRSASLLGARYKDTTFKNTDTTVGGDFMKAYNRCRKYCEISAEALQNGYGIYIYGNSGTGKTHLTACICNELINQYRQCLFTNFFEISKMIRATFSKSNTDAETVIKRICEVDFLFIDDLGTEALQRSGEDTWLQDQVFDIINKRYNNNKPTIFSSNHSLGELISDRGMMQKTVERIMEMSTAIIKVEGQSYRPKKRGKDVPF